MPGGALANELRHFLQCVKTRAQPAITMKDAAETLRLSRAMEALADQRQKVHLSEFGLRDAV
jgi:predicted dehydrogenase